MPEKEIVPPRVKETRAALAKTFLECVAAVKSKMPASLRNRK
jgi:hypothetical protein